MTTPDFSLEAESSCRAKLANSKRRTRGCSGVDLRWWGGGGGGGGGAPRECELVDDVVSEVVDVRGLVAGVTV